MVLPKKMSVAVHSSAKVGQLNILGHEVDGTTIDSYVTARGGDSNPLLTLNIEMGAGEVTVIRS